MPRTKLTDEGLLDIAVVQEKEFNDFFGTTIVTGTPDNTSLTTQFLPYLAGSNFVRASDDITVTSGTDFVTIGRQHVAEGAADDTVSSTSSTSFINKVSLNTGPIADGQYKLTWYYEWNYDARFRDFRARILFESALTLMEHVQEPQEDDSDQWAPASGLVFGSLPAGTYTIDLQFASSSFADVASIRRARILLESL